VRTIGDPKAKHNSYCYYQLCFATKEATSTLRYMRQYVSRVSFYTRYQEVFERKM